MTNHGGLADAPGGTPIALAAAILVSVKTLWIAAISLVALAAYGLWRLARPRNRG